MCIRIPKDIRYNNLELCKLCINGLNAEILNVLKAGKMLAFLCAKNLYSWRSSINKFIETV